MSGPILLEVKDLQFENMSFGYENQAAMFTNTTFSFPMNKIVWVQAESGAGRSTLLQLMGSLLLPQTGSYIINGKNVTEMTFEEFLPYRLQIGYGFDMGGVIHNRTILENLTLPLFYHKTLSQKLATKRAEKYLERMGIYKHRDHRPSVVPGAVRKIVCLLRALIMHPQILLLDDPTVGINRDIYLQYFDLVSDLRSMGCLNHIFMSSFDEQLLDVLKPTTIAIDNGHLYHYDVELDNQAVGA